LISIFLKISHFTVIPIIFTFYFEKYSAHLLECYYRAKKDSARDLAIGRDAVEPDFQVVPLRFNHGAGGSQGCLPFNTKGRLEKISSEIFDFTQV
jgi:hypothetical protein